MVVSVLLPDTVIVELVLVTVDPDSTTAEPDTITVEPDTIRVEPYIRVVRCAPVPVAALSV
jgi:hypothetical protein